MNLDSLHLKIVSDISRKLHDYDSYYCGYEYHKTYKSQIGGKKNCNFGYKIQFPKLYLIYF